MSDHSEGNPKEPGKDPNETIPPIPPGAPKPPRTIISNDDMGEEKVPPVPPKTRLVSKAWPDSFEPVVDSMYIPVDPIDITFGVTVIQGGRPNVEDDARVDHITTAGGLDLTVALVADGVGGNVFGEEASRQTVRTVFDYIAKSPLNDKNGIPILVQYALEEANREVYRRSRTEKDKRGMATTAVLVVIHQNLLFLGNVGDSRAYVMRDNQLIQLSMDHAWENEVVREGHYQLEEARKHPKAGELRRSIGTKADLTIDLGFYPEQDPVNATNLAGTDLKVWQLFPGDRIVLCSDGLIKERHDNIMLQYVSDAEIIRGVLANEPQTATEQLTNLASQRKVDDNVSVIVLETAGSERVKKAAPILRTETPARSGNRTWIYAVLGVIVIAILAALGLLFLGGGNDATEPTAVAETQPTANTDSVVVETEPTELPTATATSEPSATPLPPAELPNGVAVSPPELADFLDPSGDSITLPPQSQALLVTSQNSRFEVKTPFGATAVLSGGGMMGIIYNHPDSFELHCLIGNCEINGDQSGQTQLNEGQLGIVGVTGIPGEPEPARYEEFGRFSASVPTPSPTPLPTATPTLTPLPPTNTPAPIPTAAEANPEATEASTDPEPAVNPLDPDGDGVLHDPANGQFDLCQDAPGNPGTCGCPAGQVPSSCGGGGGDGGGNAPEPGGGGSEPEPPEPGRED